MHASGRGNYTRLPGAPQTIKYLVFYVKTVHGFEGPWSALPILQAFCTIRPARTPEPCRESAVEHLHRRLDVGEGRKLVSRACMARLWQTHSQRTDQMNGVERSFRNVPGRCSS